MVWQPETPPPVESVEEAIQWVFAQFQQMAKDAQETLTLELRPSAAAPERPREGMIVYADGTNWDPGLGAGVYVYKSGAWHYLAAEESGTFTPALTFATPGDLSVAYTSRSGVYRKVGSRVFGWMSLLTSTWTHTTAAGFFKITGLPYSPAASLGFTTAGTILINYTKANYTQLALECPNGAGAFFYVGSIGSAQAGPGAQELVAANLPSGTQVGLMANFSYVT